jgi:hypothetical protein
MPTDSSVILLTAPRSAPDTIVNALRFKTYEEATKFVRDNTVALNGQMRFSEESGLSGFIHPSELLTDEQFKLVRVGSLYELIKNALDVYNIHVISVPYLLKDQAALLK